MSSQGLNDSVSEVGKGRFRPEAVVCSEQVTPEKCPQGPV